MNWRFFRLWPPLFALSWLFSPCLTPAAKAEAMEVRVLVVESAPQLTISSPTALRLSGCTPSSLPQTLAPEQRVTIAYDPSGLRVGGHKAEGHKALLVQTDPGSYLRLNGRSYRGAIEVYRSSGRESLLAINVVDLEDYLRGVIKEEISPQWPAEALKAQAVVARTFALRQILDNPQQLFHLRATTDSQLYGGRESEDYRCDLAVEQTRGMVLTLKGKPIPAFYHAACGGHTEDVGNVWSYNHSSLQGVPCSYCQEYPVYAWQVALSREEVRRSLLRAGYEVGEVEAILPLARSKTERILQLEIRHRGGRIVMEGTRFRRILGNDLIRSTNFSVKYAGDSFIFQGKGWGHGVGLCQWGTKGMAERGFSYQSILYHYYPGATLKPLEGIED